MVGCDKWTSLQMNCTLTTFLLSRILSHRRSPSDLHKSVFHFLSSLLGSHVALLSLCALIGKLGALSRRSRRDAPLRTYFAKSFVSDSSCAWKFHWLKTARDYCGARSCAGNLETWSQHWQVALRLRCRYVLFGQIDCAVQIDWKFQRYTVCLLGSVSRCDTFLFVWKIIWL